MSFTGTARIIPLAGERPDRLFELTAHAGAFAPGGRRFALALIITLKLISHTRLDEGFIKRPVRIRQRTTNVVGGDALRRSKVEIGPFEEIKITAADIEAGRAFRERGDLHRENSG